MKLKEIFSRNTLYSIGIEEEYMICNPISGNLSNKANQIMNYIKYI